MLHFLNKILRTKIEYFIGLEFIPISASFFAHFPLFTCGLDISTLNAFDLLLHSLKFYLPSSFIFEHFKNLEMVSQLFYIL